MDARCLEDLVNNVRSNGSASAKDCGIAELVTKLLGTAADVVVLLLLLRLGLLLGLLLFIVSILHGILAPLLLLLLLQVRHVLRNRIGKLLRRCLGASSMLGLALGLWIWKRVRTRSARLATHWANVIARKDAFLASLGVPSTPPISIDFLDNFNVFSSMQREVCRTVGLVIVTHLGFLVSRHVV